MDLMGPMGLKGKFSIHTHKKTINHVAKQRQVKPIMEESIDMVPIVLFFRIAIIAKVASVVNT